MRPASRIQSFRGTRRASTPDVSVARMMTDVSTVPEDHEDGEITIDMMDDDTPGTPASALLSASQGYVSDGVMWLARGGFRIEAVCALVAGGVQSVWVCVRARRVCVCGRVACIMSLSVFFRSVYFFFPQRRAIVFHDSMSFGLIGTSHLLQVGSTPRGGGGMKAKTSLCTQNHFWLYSSPQAPLHAPMHVSPPLLCSSADMMSVIRHPTNPEAAMMDSTRRMSRALVTAFDDGASHPRPIL